MVYARWYSELPTTFAKARNAKKGELKKFDTIVKARVYGMKMTDHSGVVLIFSKDPERYLYAINNPLQNPDLIGYVDNLKNRGYWNIPFGTDRKTGDVVFTGRPIHTNGKLAERF